MVSESIQARRLLVLLVALLGKDIFLVYSRGEGEGEGKVRKRQNTQS